MLENNKAEEWIATLFSLIQSACIWCRVQTPSFCWICLFYKPKPNVQMTDGASMLFRFLFSLLCYQETWWVGGSAKYVTISHILMYFSSQWGCWDDLMNLLLEVCMLGFFPPPPLLFLALFRSGIAVILALEVSQSGRSWKPLIWFALSKLESE